MAIGKYPIAILYFYLYGEGVGGNSISSVLLDASDDLVYEDVNS